MAGSERPTMVDVAADAGVSLKTVSRVINDVPTVDPALVDRVGQSIDKLGFRRNAIAASLRAGSSDIIGLVTADLANSFYTTIASAVSTVALDRGYQVIMASTEEDSANERTIAIDLCQRRVRGLIVVPSAGDQGYLEAEVRMGVPVVFLDRPGKGIQADSVLLDNRGGARDAMAELLAAGHTRIAMLFDSLSIFTMAERYAGVTDALTAEGITADPSLVAFDLHSPAVSRAAMERILNAPEPPTAVFCANNRVTIGAVEAIVPRGAATEVVGFDDFELSQLLPREVTIVDYDAAELGAVAAETLFSRIDGDTAPPVERLMPTTLVRRGGFASLR